MRPKRGFASDNNSGVHPDIFAAMGKVNEGHTIAYGNDKYTREAEELFKIILGQDTEVFFVFTGTAANVLSLDAITQSWNSVITAFSAHIEKDECGAAEKFTGSKILTCDTENGKLTPDHIVKHLTGFDFEHHSQPKVVSITQATEMGTIYSPDEIKELAEFVHSYDLLLHMDGARIANAAAALDLPFRDFTTDAGVDILSFGGTKNGMMYGESVCFLKPGLSENFKYIRKQGMQLASKMRFIAAQYIAYFRNDLWLRNAHHANVMATKLEEKLRTISGITVTQPAESNGVFVIMDPEIADSIREKYFFYPWNPLISEYRLMTSWDTEEEDIKGFVSLLKKELG